MTWSLTPGQAADGPEGRRLIESMGGPHEAGEVALLMDSAYEGDATRELAQQLGFMPVVPPNPQRKQPWTLDKERYRRRNEVERLLDLPEHLLHTGKVAGALIGRLLQKQTRNVNSP